VPAAANGELVPPLLVAAPVVVLVALPVVLAPLLLPAGAPPDVLPAADPPGAGTDGVAAAEAAVDPMLVTGAVDGADEPPHPASSRAETTTGSSRRVVTAPILPRRYVRVVAESFFLPLGEGRWRATVHTTGPWDERFQHGGPPSALLGRAVETVAPRPDVTVARMTVEILGPIPVGDLELRSAVVRPGRSVELVEAVLSAGGRDVARASAWRVLRTAARSIATRLAPPPVLPDESAELGHGDWVDGYLSAIDWRFARGHFTERGPAAAWTRLRVSIVPDEPPSPLQRVLAVADSGNGISSELNLTKWHFINPELTVHLHREAVGEWICLDAMTSISTDGVGLATSVLSDVEGPVGVGAQSLLVARR
jgi:hypothetical protein